MSPTPHNGKFYITLWGGLGDFLKIYYTHHVWRCLEHLKTKYPSCHVKALIYSLNPSSQDLITHHPAINEVFQPELPLLEMRKKGLKAFAGEHTPLGSAGPWVKSLKGTRTKVYLSPQDQQFVTAIKKQAGKYIAIHPFSAMPGHLPHSRTTMSADNYLPIIEGLKKNGYNVVILGKSRPHRAETFEFEADNIINLVNKTNVREALTLVNDAAGFIGANSGFMCSAWLEKKRSFVITSYLWKTQITKNGFTNRRWQQPQNKVVFLPKERASAPYDKIQQEAINWFR